MSLQNYEGTAIDTEMFNQEPDVQPIEEPIQTDVVETVEPQEGGTTTPEEPTSVNIPGLGEVSFADIKEWKNGNLRQADYTRKTQELARQRAKSQQANDLLAYLQGNPHIVEAMKQAEANPNSVVHSAITSAERQMIQDIAYKQRAFETDMKLAKLHEQYGEIDEIALLNKAAELRTDDLEFVYKALAFDNNTVDREALIAQAKEDLKAELLADKQNLGTTIVNTQQSAPTQQNRTLTASEQRVARGMGLSDAEYLKWAK